MATLGYYVIFSTYVFSLVLIPIVINRRKRPVVTLAWIMAIIFIPFLGAILFLVFGTERIVNKGRIKLFSNEYLKKHLAELEEQWAPRFFKDAHYKYPGNELENVIKISEKYGLFKAMGHNRIKYLVDADRAFPEMEEAIGNARNHINLEFYIFRPDKTGRVFKDLLIERARKGVRVNFLFDALGSMDLAWNRSFMNDLKSAGIKAKKFLPLNQYIKPWNINLRNHRKLLVIDNSVGFTGSVNIGSDFISKPNKKFGAWRETHIKVEGPLVSQLQWIFCEDWYFSTGEALVSPQYFAPAESKGETMAQVVASGPDVREKAIYKIFLMAIYQARNYVYITTPYFIPDRSLILALKMAAARGVEVKILVPRKSDHGLVLMAGRSYYEELMQEGVQIYEFTAGHLHAKMLVVDDNFTIIGSANADIRSFDFDFEINVQLYGRDEARQASEIFQHDLTNAVKLELPGFLARPLREKLIENFCRLSSPLL
jgi:cardiolipin synthase